MSFKNIYFVIFLIVFFSCVKNKASLTLNNSSNFGNLFESFWNDMNINYVYWSIDTTDWDHIYKKYRPIFEGLDVNSDNDLKKSVQYLRTITEGLIDNHYSITFTNGVIKDSFLYPALSQKLHKSNFHSPFLFESIDTNYLDRGFVSGEYISINDQRIQAFFGTIQNKILYFSCNQFALQEAFLSKKSNTLRNVIDSFFTVAKNPPPNIKGLIIDVRTNSGGNISDLNFFLGNFINKPLKFGYTRYKNGNGRLDYTPWIDATVFPQPGHKSLTLAVVVLADNYSISLAEVIAMAIKAMPNSIFVGQRTWGATGPITDNSVYNFGPFEIPGFLKVTTSSASFKYLDDKIYEGIGFPPDVEVPFDFNALQSGSDPQLEKAINIFK